ncbi:13450_t:CDS:2 [Entrophospora sp. SA101]|nr:13450_t:CDS:2 [Entrophospora sp. SA101]
MLEGYIKGKNEKENKQKQLDQQLPLTTQITNLQAEMKDKKKELDRLLAEKDSSNTTNKPSDKIVLYIVSGVIGVVLIFEIKEVEIEFEEINKVINSAEQKEQNSKIYRKVVIQQREIKQPILPKSKEKEVKIINLAIHLEKLTAQLSDGVNIYFPEIDEVLGYWCYFKVNDLTKGKPAHIHIETSREKTDTKSKDEIKVKKIKEEIKSPTPFTFALTCPHCQKSLTAQDFDNNHFTIAHLQSYFQHKETEYKQQIRQQLEQEITSLPIFQQLKSENEKLKLIVEGYKLGSTKNTDEVSKITHVGEKADIIQEIYHGDQKVAKIIYEIKNTDKWDNK